MAGMAEPEPCEPGSRAEWTGNAGKIRAGWRCSQSTNTSKRGRNIPQPPGLVLELSNGHYLKRESSSQSPIPHPLLQGDWAGQWGPVSRDGMQWVSQDTAGVPARSLAPGGSCQHLHGKMPVSLLLSLSNIPQISSLLQQPSKVRMQGRTTRTWRGWLGKQQVPKSGVRSSIPFVALPKREFSNSHIHLRQEGKDLVPGL